MKILHIGFGKTGTSFLQKEIFPQLSKKFNIPVINLNELYSIKKVQQIKYHPLENKDKIDMPRDFIISNEALVGVNWEPYKFYRAFNENKRIFSKDTKIIIYIRRPSEFFNSVYLQSIKLLNIKKQEDFFINEENYSNKKNCYNVYGFSYVNLIKLYKSHFDSVYVEKYENFNQFNVLKKIFNLNNEDICDFQKKNIINMSLTSFSVKTLFFLSNFFDLKKYDRFIRSKISQKYNFKDKILRNLMIRSIINKLNNFIPSKKFKLSFKNFPINISNLDKEYEDLKI
jgi:hypothetical protein